MKDFKGFIVTFLAFIVVGAAVVLIFVYIPEWKGKKREPAARIEYTDDDIYDEAYKAGYKDGYQDGLDEGTDIGNEENELREYDRGYVDGYYDCVNGAEPPTIEESPNSGWNEGSQ